MCFFSACVYAAWWPYVDAEDSWLALLCQGSIFFALLASVVNAFDGSLPSHSSMDVLLVLVTLLPVAFAIFGEVPFALMSLFEDSALGQRWKELRGKSKAASHAADMTSVSSTAELP